MAWDIIHEEKHPCPCGKSTYTDMLVSDDWNRTEPRSEMDCPECKLNYRLEKGGYYHSGQWEETLKWVKK